MSAADLIPDVSSRVALTQRMREIAPAILFGLRLWASVCLAFYVAFRLELSQPAWAATTAALVCQPALGASLRKASFRMVGTVVGAIGAVALAALFRQDRLGFLTGLALGCAASVFVGTLLRNYAAYGAALAGFTAAILASDILGPTGDANVEVLIVAINRAVEICIGIVSAGVVLSLTDFGHSRRLLAAEFARLSQAAAQGLAECLAPGGPDPSRSTARRRALMASVIALDPLIDTAVGEASDLRRHSPVLQQAVRGLLDTIVAWRETAAEIARLPAETARRDAATIYERLPIDLFAWPIVGRAADAVELRRACGAAARSLVRFETQTPSQRLIADTAAEGMLGAAKAFNGLIETIDPRRALSARKAERLTVPDWLPPIVNALRAFVIVALLSLFWIATAWPSGTLAITFGAVVAVLFPLQGDQAYSAAMTFLQGCVIAAVLAATLIFFVLPHVSSFVTLCLVLGTVLIPCGVFIALPWRPTLFFAASVNMLPMLSITNTMAYDAAQFCNTAIAIVAGIGVGAMFMRIAPPVPPALRTRRLLRLMLEDLRRLARRRDRDGGEAWTNRARARLMALPIAAEPSQRGEAASVFATGVELIRLRRVAPRFVEAGVVGSALEAFARADSSATLAALGEIDRRLAALPPAAPGGRVALRLRASILAIGGEISGHPSLYGAGSVP